MSDAAFHLGASRMGHIVLDGEKTTRSASYMPTESWWVGKSREAFTKARLQNQTRMEASRYGQMQLLTVSADYVDNRWKKKPEAA